MHSDKSHFQNTGMCGFIQSVFFLRKKYFYFIFWLIILSEVQVCVEQGKQLGDVMEACVPVKVQSH